MTAYIELWSAIIDHNVVKVDYTIYEDQHESDIEHSISADALVDFIDEQGLNIINGWYDGELEEHRLDEETYLNENLSKVVKLYLEDQLLDNSIGGQKSCA